MDELVVSTLDSIMCSVEKEVLVETVRLIQKKGLNGSQGDWKEFLNSHDRKFGASLSDPSKRSVDVLSAFIKSFNQPKDLKFLCNIFRQYSVHKALEQHSLESTDEESPQQRLVRLTMDHPLYKKHYSFLYYDNKDWQVVPTHYISKAKQPNSMLSVDCEMVLCHDGTEEVVQVCIVDEKLKVKLKTLVKPNKPVADYRSAITGVVAEDLEGVTCSLANVQRTMIKLLRNGTILVGHSVHCDLKVLKIVHQRVIDTAYIFKYSEGSPTFTPSLNNLCKAVLNFELRKKGEPHNCRKDAEASMSLVLAKIEHGYDDLIDVMGVSDVNQAELLLHKIPVETPRQELLKIFPQDFNFNIEADLKIRGSFYSTRVLFKDACEANKAFQRVEGEEKKDSVGRLQKLVFLKLSTGQVTSFFLRKMTTISSIPEDGGPTLTNISSHNIEGTDLKRRKTTAFSAEEDEGRDSELKKSHLSIKPCSSELCEHAREIERLKQKISAREDEIFKLQKTLAGLDN